MGLVFNVVTGSPSPFIEKTVSGNPIAVSDVYGVQHNVACKISGVADPAAVTVTSYGSNLIDFLTASYSPAACSYEINRGSLALTDETAEAGWSLVQITFNDIFFPKGKYYFTCDFKATGFATPWIGAVGKKNGVTVFNIGEHGTGGEHLDMHIEAASDFDYMHLQFYVYESTKPDGKQIGSKAIYRNMYFGAIENPSDVSYTMPTMFTPKADGSISGMTSLSPNMTIFADNAGALITATYKADRFASINNDIQALNRSLDNTNNAVLATGGNL